MGETSKIYPFIFNNKWYSTRLKSKLSGYQIRFGYAHDKEIYSLEVEGQKPDGIIEYEEYGRTMYMWYYNDLKSNKRGDCLSYSVDVPE